MRTASIKRDTNETKITLELNLDGTGKADVASGCGFLDHMLELFAFHGSFDLTVKCKGDTWVDDHHTIEDTGIVLGNAIKEAIGNKKQLQIDMDYGSYNIGKALHIGHLRTTVVGDTFNRIARFLGHKTKSYNHMGDWGRPMGLIIAWILEYGMPKNADDINVIYPASTSRAKEDKKWLETAQKITFAKVLWILVSSAADMTINS